MSNADESAFPVSHVHFQDGPMGGELFGGLTKREYIATKVLQGILSSVPGGAADDDAPHVMKLVVAFTDALLAELAKESK